MSLGSSISTYALTEGSGETTFTKVKDGVYRATITANAADSPAVVTLIESPIGTAKRRVTASLAYSPCINDSPSAATRGKVYIEVKLTGTVGSDVAEGQMATWLSRLASILLHSGITTGLLSGSRE